MPRLLDSASAIAVRVRAVRVRRRRGIHVLMGTLALVAGCSTAQRAELRGTVRDRATGRVIAGARVIGGDGALAETDAEGRFQLYVRGEHADLRISAIGHSPSHVEIDGLEANVELAPIDRMWGDPTFGDEMSGDGTWGAPDEGAHVVSFVEETWTLDATHASDASVPQSCAETSLAQAHSAIACVSCHEAPSAVSSCTSCHASEAAAIRGLRTGTRIAAHDGLGGGCLACHGEVARGDANGACARCHGTDASTRTAELGRSFALATSSTALDDAHGTTFEMRSTLAGTRVALATWARALAVDRSRGAHDPGAALAVGRALAP
jgi:hypothetical protein